ncbi:MAG: phosphate acetyltransferase [Lachnospiraceae bacterium]|nr:phosphate acetyltransferase [Clostridiales bacterium]MBR6852079.1 phosphate acetyltransferase [Lachnospiraceae bacterium]
MSMLEKIKNKARANVKKIVLPEGDEPRTVKAAVQIVKEGLATPILLGAADKIAAVASEQGVDISGIETIDPATSEKAKEYAQVLFELRKAKGVTEEDAAKLVSDPMYYGIMMVKLDEADGLVSGAVHTTGDMLRPALQIIKAKPGMSIVSSSFLMECPNKELGEDGLLVYADCVVNPCPNAQELAQIAVSAAETARVLCGIEEPRVALLSFSTKGSAKHDLVTKVQEATKIAHELAPDLLLDGEMQFDAALVPSVGASKAPGSPVAGRANVLIFPDLQAGNIGYKITQRIGNADCFAVLQGLAKPCNDLSRGCSVEDIVNTVAMTAVQATC